MEIGAKKTVVRRSVYQVSAAKILQHKTLETRSLSEGRWFDSSQYYNSNPDCR